MAFYSVYNDFYPKPNQPQGGSIGGNYGLTGIERLAEKAKNRTQSWGSSPSSENGSGVGTNFMNSISPYTASGGQKPQYYNLSPEQDQTMKDMSEYFKTGNYNDIYTAGQEYGGPLGSYELSDRENQARTMLEELIASGDPEGVQLAMDEYRRVLEQDSYDPYNEHSSFNGYKQNVEHELQQNSDALNRNLAAQGDLYSSRAVQEQGNLASDAQRQLTTELGRLYDSYTQRRANTANNAGQLGVYQEQIDKNRISEMERMGALERQLKNQQAKDAYQAEQNRRSELEDLLNRAGNSYPMQFANSNTSNDSSNSSSSSNNNSTQPEISYDRAGNSGVSAQKWWKHDGPTPNLYYGYRPGSNWI